ncbi:OmpA family protein [Solitalea sp. MAHUQ-68]|uniref:OmpA family protein n=1 Tax=Solitalea agri TaxID=2953739 RepID=A0A9X2F4L3_9SPHI|nr:OmpA family protein [Solitalea agri]MCO4294689.1 OmpA family protein [Solitalea agri]
MKKVTMAAAIFCTAFLFSCVSNKKLKLVKAEKEDINTQYQQLLAKQQDCESQLSKANTQVENLNQQMAYLKENNTAALKQLQDLSVISASQAESIKKSMENIGAKDVYIQDLQKSMARKDSLNMALVMNLKGAIGDLNDKDINIKVDKGVVYIDISDKLLFNSGSYTITNQAKVVLGKVAKVLLNQPNIEFMVEGHTDNKPIKNNCIEDNWDLSVKRATAVVRVLQKDYGLPAEHMTAAGRSEFMPIADNSSADGRATNRRTRIVILPQLDQFFKLLEKPKQ